MRCVSHFLWKHKKLTFSKLIKWTKEKLIYMHKCHWRLKIEADSDVWERKNVHFFSGMICYSKCKGKHFWQCLHFYLNFCPDRKKCLSAWPHIKKPHISVWQTFQEISQLLRPENGWNIIWEKANSCFGKGYPILSQTHHKVKDDPMKEGHGERKRNRSKRALNVAPK